MTTREPKEGGGCDTESKGEVQAYEYDTADRLIGEGIEYDSLGRITELPGEYAGGGKLSTAYYVNDLTRSQTQGGITNTYELDSALRQRERLREGGAEEGTEIYHYVGGSDSPSWIEEIGEGEPTWTRSIGAMGGNLGALQSSSGDITFQIADMHGDVIATADNDPEATELLTSQQFDEYGNPNGGSAPKFGWLGSKSRRTELPSGVIQMGVRSYIPAMGRFLSVDPVPGGSANAYEYAAGDPVNNFDLTGEKCVGNAKWVSRCKRKKARAARRRERRSLRKANRNGVLVFRLNQNSLSRLRNNPSLIKDMRAKAHKWKLNEKRRIERYGQGKNEAYGCCSTSHGGYSCGEIAHGLTYSGVAGFGFARIPGVGLVGVIVGTGSTLGAGATTLGSDLGLC